jgi:hypothetical protein
MVRFLRRDRQSACQCFYQDSRDFICWNDRASASGLFGAVTVALRLGARERTSIFSQNSRNFSCFPTARQQAMTVKRG